MREKNNIDKIFGAAAQGYSAPTPSGAWERLDVALKAKRRKRRFVIWFIILGLGLLILSSLFYLHISTCEGSSKRINESGMLEPDSQENLEEMQGNDKNAIEDFAEFKKVSGLEKQKLSENRVEETTSLVALGEDKLNDSNELVDFKNKDVQTKEVAFEKKTDAVTGLKSSQTDISNPSNTSEIVKEEVEADQKVELQKVVLGQLSVSHQVTIVKDSLVDTKSDSLLVENHQSEMRNLRLDSLAKDDVKQEIPVLEDQKKGGLKIQFFANIYTGFTLVGGETKSAKENSSYQSSLSLQYVEPVNIPVSAPSNLAYTSDESSSWTMNIGLDLGLQLGKRWSFSVGLKRYNLTSTGKFIFPNNKVNYVNADFFGYSSLGFYNVQNLHAVMSAKNMTTVDCLRDFENIKLKVKFMDVPINVGYNIPWRNWRFVVHGGLNITFIRGSEVLIGDDEGYHLRGELHDLENFLLGFSTGGDIWYEMNNRIHLGLKTDFIFYRGSVSSLSGFSFYPYSFSISPQLGYRF